MFPVSGALQLKTSGPIRICPLFHIGGHIQGLLTRHPYSLSGKNKFHNPSAFAFCFSSSIIGGTSDHRVFC